MVNHSINKCLPVRIITEYLRKEAIQFSST